MCETGAGQQVAQLHFSYIIIIIIIDLHAKHRLTKYFNYFFVLNNLNVPNKDLGFAEEIYYNLVSIFSKCDNCIMCCSTVSIPGKHMWHVT
jgi:hypothetical protein